jgi:hypothetical protein
MLRMQSIAAVGIAMAAAGALGGGAYFALKARQAEPTGVVVVPSVWEVGDAVWGEPRKQRFTIENHGTEVVLLRKPAPNCVCFTVTEDPALQLRPGESTSFRVHMQPDREGIGAFHKEISIVAGSQNVKVPITGEVIQPFALDTVRLDFGAVDASKGALAKKAQFRPGRGSRFVPRVTSVSTTDRRFDVKVEPAENGSDLVVTPLPAPDSPKGTVQAQVGVTIESKATGHAPLVRNGTIWVTADLR